MVVVVVVTAAAMGVGCALALALAARFFLGGPGVGGRGMFARAEGAHMYLFGWPHVLCT